MYKIINNYIYNNFIIIINNNYIYNNNLIIIILLFITVLENIYFVFFKFAMYSLFINTFLLLK